MIERKFGRQRIKSPTVRQTTLMVVVEIGKRLI
jgi:hypothetical protein